VQELGGSTARQLAQGGQWKYFIPETNCSVYVRGLAREQEFSLLQEFQLCFFSGRSKFSMILVFFKSSMKSVSSTFCNHGSGSG